MLSTSDIAGAFADGGAEDIVVGCARGAGPGSGEEGDPGRGGLPGTRPHAGQLGGPASRGLGVYVFGQSPVTTDMTTPSLSPPFHYT
eukprot:2287716-Pyramimonas_sp.AAC.1